MDKNCLNCGKRYHILPCIARTGKNRACSRKCQYILARNRVLKNCLTCNKEFYARTYDVKNGNRGKYCSRKCFIDDPKKGRKQRRLCFICRKQVFRSTHAIKSYRRYFCSKECNIKALIKEIEISCSKCNRKYRINPSQEKHKYNNYCSMTCRKRSIGECLRCHKQDKLYLNKFCRLCYRVNYQYLKKYNLSIEDYDKGVSSVCGICGVKPDKPLFVDHDHNNGKVRGFLCNQCNFLLGAAKDNVNILQSSILYLNRGDRE